jgi:hypothetical protein
MRIIREGFPSVKDGKYAEVSAGKAPWLLWEGDIYLGRVGEHHVRLAQRIADDVAEVLDEATWGTVWMHMFEPSGEVNFISKVPTEVKQEIREAFEKEDFLSRVPPRVKWS